MLHAYLQLNEDIREADSTHEVIVFGSDHVGKSTIIRYFVRYQYNLNRALDQQFVSFTDRSTIYEGNSKG